MACSEDYRKRVIEYRKEGHMHRQTCEVFKVALITIQQWEKKLREERTLKKKEKASERPFRKLDTEKLKQFLAKHPDAYVREIAVTYTCWRLKITRKKRPRIMESNQRKK